MATPETRPQTETSETRATQVSLTIEESLVEHRDLMSDLIKTMLTVSVDLGGILSRVEQVVFRQNVLVLLFFITNVLMIVQLSLGFSMQGLQQSAKVQLETERVARERLQIDFESASRDVKTLLTQLEEVNARTKTIPTITSTNGQLKLEIPLDEEAQKQAAKKLNTGHGTLDRPSPMPDRVSIPLRPTQTVYNEK